MNILIVCDYFLDYLGGAQTAIAAEAGALRDAGHAVTVVAPGRRRAGFSAAPTGTIRFRAPIVLPILDMAVVANTRSTRAQLASIIAQLSIDVVHIHSEFGLAAAAMRVADERQIPTVHTIHTFYWRSGLAAPGRIAGGSARVVARVIARVIRTLHRTATGLTSPAVRLCGNDVDDAMRGLTLATALRAGTVVSPSLHQAADLRAAGLLNVIPVPNCVRIGNGSRPRQVTTVSGPLRVLWVGRCIPEKRAIEFAEAASLACEIVGAGALQVTIAGEGPLLARIRRIASRAPGVRVLGRVDMSRITGLLADHHVTALTSLGYDNQPMTVAESITALRGVVYVDDRLHEGLDAAGIFVHDSTVEGMAAALVDLATDPRPVVAASARAVAARDMFSAQAHCASLESIYRSAPARERLAAPGVLAL